jgi:hypothetical protein
MAKEGHLLGTRPLYLRYKLHCVACLRQGVQEALPTFWKRYRGNLPTHQRTVAIES